MIWMGTKERYAIVFVDVFDATAISEGKIDSVTKKLMKAIIEKLEKKGI